MSDKELICDEDLGTCVIINKKESTTEAKTTEEFDQQSYDDKISSAYDVCDAKVPIIGHICENLNTSEGFLKILFLVTAVPLIGFVLYMDIFGDWITIVTQILADALDGVPIAGTIIGLIEAPEFDDVIDFISLVIMFVYIGPISIVGIPEFAEGILEIFPFWTAMLIAWFLFVRPARARKIQRMKIEELEARKELEEAQETRALR